MASRAKRQALNQNTCTGYGFRAGTDAYAACMMNLDQNQQADDAKRRAAVADALADSFSTGSRNQTVRVQSNCTYRAFGNTVNQTCM